jgi:transcriptional regulator EpsA
LQVPTSKIARPIDPQTREWELVRSRKAHGMFKENTVDQTSPAQTRDHPHFPRAFGLNEEDRERYLRIVADSLQIRRHYQLFLWLRGELQSFLPHQILLSAWGNFGSLRLHFDLISSLPGVRTSELAHCDINGFVQALHLRWIKAERTPVLLCAADIAPALTTACNCPIHSKLREMRSLVVHGVRDERGSPECLYVALHTGSLTQGRPRERFASLFDGLIAPMDIAFRKIGMLPPPKAQPAGKAAAAGLDLSDREQEILDLVRKGNTNVQIAKTLSISPFTVKNHVQRIFRKIGATNRTEAAAKYNQALDVLGRLL